MEATGRRSSWWSAGGWLNERESGGGAKPNFARRLYESDEGAAAAKRLSPSPVDRLPHALGRRCWRSSRPRRRRRPTTTARARSAWHSGRVSGELLGGLAPGHAARARAKKEGKASPSRERSAKPVPRSRPRPEPASRPWHRRARGAGWFRLPHTPPLLVRVECEVGGEIPQMLMRGSTSRSSRTHSVRPGAIWCVAARSPLPLPEEITTTGRPAGSSPKREHAGRCGGPKPGQAPASGALPRAGPAPLVLHHGAGAAPARAASAQTTLAEASSSSMASAHPLSVPSGGAAAKPQPKPAGEQGNIMSLCLAGAAHEDAARARPRARTRRAACPQFAAMQAA